MNGRMLAGLLAGATLATLASAGGESARAKTGPLRVVGDPARGAAMISAYGCGSCHMVPGVDGARGLVGPPLIAWARRTYIAGKLPNTPAYLMRWIMTPQAVEPGNAMPDLGVSQRDAADISAYLYTIR